MKLHRSFRMRLGIFHDDLGGSIGKLCSFTYPPHPHHVFLSSSSSTTTNTLTPISRYAAYWIAFGPHGPRSLPPPGEGKKVAAYTLIGLGVSLAIFATMRSFAKPAPPTMTKEWQEATNEYLKVGYL